MNQDMSYCSRVECKDKNDCLRFFGNHDDFGKNQRTSFILTEANNKEECGLFMEREDK